tara:strand:- start:264 stop:491 length:228 start_codon:yes stop_codon:yes gene_type:complete
MLYKLSNILSNCNFFIAYLYTLCRICFVEEKSTHRVVAKLKPSEWMKFRAALLLKKKLNFSDWLRQQIAIMINEQ